MTYRRDVDGLRALAVLPIVLFHAGVEAIPGGYTGVDIFFVISGFLITSIISREIADGRFSILEFYRRRVVRIVPALFVMLAVVLVAGRLLLLPSELDGLGRSAAAAAGFGSNIYFWKTARYFGSASDAKPLLHTWSLGVEEQFYIFFPLLLLLVWRFAPKRLSAALVLVSLASLAIGVMLQIKVPGGAANFYLLPSRAWELALGGLVALGAIPTSRSPGIRSALSLLGLVLIMLGLLLLRGDSAFPIPWAILPCLGAALLISQGERTFAGRWLSTGPMVAVGQLSYSLYLWHWPIIVFYRLTFGAVLTPAVTLMLIAASFAAAQLSRVLVERPFLDRYRQGPAMPKVAAGIAALTCVIVGGLAVANKFTGSRPLSPEVRRIAAYGDYYRSPEWHFQYRGLPCFPGEGQEYDAKRCLSLAADRPNVVVLGDSHGAMYWRAIQLRFPQANVLQATASGCRPVLQGGGADRCTAMVRHVLGPVAASGRVSHVILAGRWKLEDLPGVPPTIRHLRAQGIGVTVIGPTAEYDGDFAQILARAMIRHDVPGTNRLRRNEQAGIDRALAAQVRQSGARYVSAYDIECPSGVCRQQAPDGSPMQFDYGHLTLAGSRYVIDRAQISF